MEAQKPADSLGGRTVGCGRAPTGYSLGFLGHGTPLGVGGR